MMSTREKIERILSTRKGSIPTNPDYGTRMYLLRDKRASEVAVWFAKYAHEDIEKSDPSIKIQQAKLTSIDGDKVYASISVANDDTYSIEAEI